MDWTAIQNSIGYYLGSSVLFLSTKEVEKMEIDPKDLEKLKNKARRAKAKQNYEDDPTEGAADRIISPAKKAPAKKAPAKKAPTRKKKRK